MDALQRLGLERDWIYETIVATHVKGRVNSAPMGVWTPDLESIKLRVYKRTRTCEDIIENRRFVVNFPNSIKEFYGALLDEKSLNGSPFLEGCDAALEAEVSGIDDRGDCVDIAARILAYRIGENTRLINRAEYLALESLIAYSKLPSSSKTERASIVEAIKENHRIICKTTPGSRFQALVQELLGRIQ
ncbi:MAG: DUF447 family protein [Candidatus Altiarchaeota archaeon]|nr:DUF447 family protein [Candidatus Altiarchaeota archaeon]